ncbi:hypothetical protein F5I97DRAFT_1811072 [Phlebopus sp. FC_14]|nr:hypothetical protein F5I97DRAFT_1811072 [Phlebopus sp. FC_14]
MTGTRDGTCTPLSLDSRFYKLEDDDEAAFFKRLTGIDDDEQLKKHILDVQAKAYDIALYPCIRLFGFTKQVLMAGFPVYRHVLRLGREREGAILLDVGCCFGNDLRHAALDGFPAQNMVGSDVLPGLWDLGHELFRSTPATFPARFVGGDALDPRVLAVAPIMYDEADVPPPPDLTTLTCLNTLRGSVSVIHASSFFHLFNGEKQLHLARALAGLLSPRPGSVIFGLHAGAHETGWIDEPLHGARVNMFCHNAESWDAMWDGGVFEEGTVRTESVLVPYPAGDDCFWVLEWSVTRL